MQPRTISPSPDISLATTAPRVTPSPPRATRFGEVLSATVVRSAETAMSKLPGAPMMAAAVRSASTPGAIGASAGGMTNPQGPLASVGVSSGAAGLAGAGAGAGVEGSLQQSQDMNLYFLQLQEAMSAQNREYTAVSNVLKAKHDTVKNAIGNIR